MEGNPDQYGFDPIYQEDSKEEAKLEVNSYSFPFKIVLWFQNLHSNN